MEIKTRVFLLGLFLALPFLFQAQTCQTPISATLDTVICNDNNTPLDSLDDVFTYFITVTGDSTTWSIESDTVMYPYGTPFVFGPAPIGGGPLTVVVISNSDSLCTDSLTITPPPPCSTPPPMCQTPISGSVDSIVCDDNGTPLDSLDDTFTFFLTVTGGANTWSFAGDSMVFPYDTALLNGPFSISGGMFGLVVVDNDDSVCTDTISVTPPAPCSVAPMCQTPISASFADILCNDQGTPLDSLDDTFTLQLTVTGGTTSWSLSGDTLMFPYDSASTVGPYIIASGPVMLTVVDNADSLCMDTVTVTPPPPCSVPPNACDVKEIGCIKYELLGVTADSAQAKTYTIMVTNNCPDKMIYTAFQVPDGLVADSPDNNAIYMAPSGREYEVRNPNFSPMYSIRFKSMTDSIAGGQSDVFEYTLPPQADPDYILAVTRIYPKVFYQAHLNTFGCKDSTTQIVGPNTPTVNDPKAGPNTNNPNTPPVTPPDPAPDASFTAYPNPTTGGQIMLDIADWDGHQVEVQLFSPKGNLLKTETFISTGDLQAFDLPKGLDAGLYWIKLVPAKGLPVVQQLVIQW